MSVLNVIANVVGVASMVTILSGNFHHTLPSAQIKFISLSFSFLRQLLFSHLQTRLIECGKDATFVYNSFGTIRTLRMS